MASLGIHLDMEYQRFSAFSIDVSSARWVTMHAPPSSPGTDFPDDHPLSAQSSPAPWSIHRVIPKYTEIVYVGMGYGIYICACVYPALPCVRSSEPATTSASVDGSIDIYVLVLQAIPPPPPLSPPHLLPSLRCCPPRSCSHCACLRHLPRRAAPPPSS